MRTVGVATLAFGWLLASAAAQPIRKDLPPVYFWKTWCPTRADLALLSQELDLEMDGCCIHRGYPKSDAAAAVIEAGGLAPWKQYIAGAYRTQLGACQGTNAEIEEEKQRAEKERVDREEAQKRAIERELEAQAAKANEDYIKGLPKELRDLDLRMFCQAYGQTLRRGNDVIYGNKLIEITRAEARRRKLVFTDSMVLSQKIRIGQSRCQMYAAWGLPSDENRSVGQWGEHIQHVYGDGTYIYTENGVITSYQD